MTKFPPKNRTLDTDLECNGLAGRPYHMHSTITIQVSLMLVWKGAVGLFQASNVLYQIFKILKKNN